MYYKVGTRPENMLILDVLAIREKFLEPSDYFHEIFANIIFYVFAMGYVEPYCFFFL